MGEREGSPFPQIPAHLRQLLALPWVFQHRNQRRLGADSVAALVNIEVTPRQNRGDSPPSPPLSPVRPWASAKGRSLLSAAPAGMFPAARAPGAAPSQADAESQGLLDFATLEHSQAPRSPRHHCWRRRIRPRAMRAARGPAALSGPGRAGGGHRRGTGPRRGPAATARPVPPPAQRATPRGALAAPPTGCSSSARRRGPQRPPASRSCYGAG